MSRPTPPPRELTYVPLSRLSADTSFRIRLGGDVSSLARSIAQAGQLFPIEVRPHGDGYQAITGFRRLAALKILHRDRVLVRIHGEISDAAAALIAAADALDNKPMEKEELLELRERYHSMAWSTPALEELIGRAIEKAEERLEDLAAQLAGMPLPDRTIEDEDAIDDDEIHGTATGEQRARATTEGEQGGATVPGAAATADQNEAGPALPAAVDRQNPSGTNETSAATADGQEQDLSPALAPLAADTGFGPEELSPLPVDPPSEPPGPIALGRPRSRTASVPPGTDVAPTEMTAAELAEDLARRMSLLTQDLALIADAWAEVPAPLRGVVADQINYYRQLGAWMEQASGDLK